MWRSTLTFAGNTIRRILGNEISTFQRTVQPLMALSFKPQSSSFSTLNRVESYYPRVFLQPSSEKSLEFQRSLTKFSLQSGKRKSVKAVLKRFYRLNWGIWIHAKCGRNKKLYRKSGSRKRRLRQHVFTNATQSWLLDSMVTRFWRKPKYYVDDPYEPYHKREEFPYTRKKSQIPQIG